MSDYLVVFDTETGGIEPDKPTIQLAAVVLDEQTWAEQASFEAKIIFEESLANPEALKICHYDKAVWDKEALPSSEVADRFAKFVEPWRSIPMLSKKGTTYYVAKLAGYNALTFDLPRLRAMFGDRFFPCSYQVRDVLQRVIFYFDEHDVIRPKDLKLGTVCAYFNIPVADTHDALADVRLTAALYGRIRA